LLNDDNGTPMPFVTAGEAKFFFNNFYDFTLAGIWICPDLYMWCVQKDTELCK
jgi:hypothetical protein